MINASDVLEFAELESPSPLIPTDLWATGMTRLLSVPDWVPSISVCFEVFNVICRHKDVNSSG